MFRNNTSLRNNNSLTCTWVRTGNPRRPLACIWTGARADTHNAETGDSGSWRMCA